MVKEQLKKLAESLHKKTANWSTTKKILFLASVYLLIGGSSIYCIVNSGNISRSIQQLFQHSQQIKPVIPPVLFPDTFQLSFDTTVLNRFNAILDSLMQTDSGKQQLKEFQQQRPGFLDSVRRAESLFNHFIIP